MDESSPISVSDHAFVGPTRVAVAVAVAGAVAVAVDGAPSWTTRALPNTAACLLFQATALTSNTSQLNGVPLVPAANHSLPDVVAMGRHVKSGAHGGISLPARSYGYVLLPAAGVAACG